MSNIIKVDFKKKEGTFYLRHELIKFEGWKDLKVKKEIDKFQRIYGKDFVENLHDAPL